MTRNLTDRLTLWLAAPPPWQMGEIIICPSADGFELRHHEDVGKAGLDCFSDPADARRLALYDDPGTYRPLKTAPNLRHGWRLALRNIDELHKALDYFYPAMLGILRAWEEGTLEPVTLRETLERQSGMYAVTRKISDAQADAMIGDFCNSHHGCLKTILWRINPDLPIRSLPPEKFQAEPPGPDRRNLPTLCQEACNLLVARARTIVKTQGHENAP